MMLQKDVLSSSFHTAVLSLVLGYFTSECIDCAFRLQYIGGTRGTYQLHKLCGGDPKLTMGYYNQGVAENEYVRFLQNGVVTAANSHINNYSKNIISLQPVGPLSSVGPWASAP